MSLKNKVLLILAFLVTCLFVSDIIYLKHQNHQLEDKAAKIELTANLEIGRAHTTIANAESKIKSMDAQIQQDVKDHKALVDSYTVLIAKNDTKGSGTLVIKEVPGKDVPGPVREIFTTVNGGPVQLKNLPFEFDDFRLHVTGDAVTKSFSYKLDQQFEVQLVAAELKNGAHNHYAELYELDSGGKRINKLTLTKFEVTETDINTTSIMRWFDWRLDLGVTYDIYKNLDHGIGGELGLSMASYGNPSILTWRFIRGSVGLNGRDIFLGLSPIQYNIGAPLPLLSNLWITPELAYGLNTKSYLLGIGISVIL